MDDGAYRTDVSNKYLSKHTDVSNKYLGKAFVHICFSKVLVDT